ncbi:MAG: xylose ABC transporter ATP-binding protein [Lachnospiraceae bacterium]
MSDYILQMEHITKEFPGVKALDDVTFQVERGNIHALCGENGAGKSTLMKVLSGVYKAGTFTGDLIYDEEKQKFLTIKDSEKVGISIIHQELGLAKNLSVIDNIFLGNEIKRNGVINKNEQYRRCNTLLKKVGLDISPDIMVKKLGTGIQQLIEIAKALNKNTRLLILDEPTSSLTEADANNLLDLICELRNDGVTCIYISHKLNEIFRIANTVTILRDGKTIVTKKITELSEDALIAYMVGRELTERFPHVAHEPGEIMLETKEWTVHNPDNADKLLLDNINIHARRGEILGIAGLMGAGRTELAMSFLGALKAKAKGEILIHGQEFKVKDPKSAIQAGIGYVSEDRKGFGLVLSADLKSNMSLASMDRITNHGILDKNKEIANAQKYISELRIKTPSMLQKAKNLSGGNQQKVVLAKWLLTHPDILILDEPTRGIDVGSKYEIYQLMNQLVTQGVCIIMISSELPEILGMSDRIYVMYEGKIRGELNRNEATQERILHYAAGGE